MSDLFGRENHLYLQISINVKKKRAQQISVKNICLAHESSTNNICPIYSLFFMYICSLTIVPCPLPRWHTVVFTVVLNKSLSAEAVENNEGLRNKNHLVES